MSAADRPARATCSAPPNERGRRRAAGALVAAACAAAACAAAACVQIETAPDGVASLRLDPLPPSVVAGDTLRDSLGVVARLRATAFDDDGAQVEGVPFLFGALPISLDTAAAARLTLVVDSLTGVVTDTGPQRTAAPARVSVRLGERLQLLDTVTVVPRPDSLVRASAADTAYRVFYLCTDDARSATLSDSSTAINGRIGNVTPALAARLVADSARTLLNVPGYYVRWEIRDTEPALAPIPVGVAPHGDERPALYFTGATTDRPLTYDTTGAGGTAGTRLRILPSLLSRALVPDDTLRVRVRAIVRAPALAARPAVGDTLEFRVRFVRRAPTGSGGTPLACP